MDRDIKILKISRSHVAPNMSVVKQQAIFAEYSLKTALDWERLTDGQLDEIIRRIVQIVRPGD